MRDYFYYGINIKCVKFATFRLLSREFILSHFFVEPLIADSTSCHEQPFMYVRIIVKERHSTVTIKLNVMRN